MPERKKRKLAAWNSQITADLTANRQLVTSLAAAFHLVSFSRICFGF
jgi:hypothetical protein